MAVFELPRPRRTRALGGAALAALSAALVSVWGGLGILSLPGLLALLAAGSLGMLAVLAYAPGVLAVLTPCLMPLQVQGLVVFPFELVFGVFAGVVVLHAVSRKSAWLGELEPLELANLGFVAWAAFTGLWLGDPIQYLLGVHRLLLGWLTFWVAWRGARLMSRTTLELSVIGGAAALAGTALLKQASYGASPLISRGAATNLGWGAANYIATLLLVLTPIVIVIGWRTRAWTIRIATLACLAMIGYMQFVIASRAATALFVGAVLVQVTGSVRGRYRLAMALALVLVVAGVMLSPLGGSLLARFQDPRDVGSMVVRLWYMREAWHRTVDHLPWGIGLGQGYGYPDHLQRVDPHDYWLVVSSELGIPGVLLWITVLVLLWRRIGLLARDSRWRQEGRALQIAFCASQLHSLVEPTFQGVHYQYVFFWVMGGVLALPLAARPRSESHSARPIAAARSG
jgi:O-antigen ligase/polysaccharide polymerase Wzy-like membrane protein